METERIFTLAENIKLAELEGRGQVILGEKAAVLNKRREATEAWQTAERKRNDFCEKLKTEPQYISDAIVRVTEAIINCDDLASAAVTGQALSGWRTIEAVWPARRSRLEAAIGELEARIEELQAEEKRHLSREAQLQKDIDGIKRDAQKIIG